MKNEKNIKQYNFIINANKHLLKEKLVMNLFERDFKTAD